MRGKKARDIRRQAEAPYESSATGIGRSLSSGRGKGISSDDGTKGPQESGEAPITNLHSLLGKLVINQKGEIRHNELATLIILAAIGWVFVQDNDKGRLSTFRDLGFAVVKGGIVALIGMVVLGVYRSLARRDEAKDYHWATHWKTIGIVLVSIALAAGVYFFGKVRGEQAMMDKYNLQDQPLTREAQKALDTVRKSYEQDVNAAKQRYYQQVRLAERLYREP